MNENSEQTTIKDGEEYKDDDAPSDVEMISVNDDKSTCPLLSYDTLVLSGGSTKGLIILGSLQYLYDNFYLKEIKNYIGTSSGSIICFLLAIGYTPIEIIVYICTHQLLERIQHFNVVAMINGGGASSFISIYEQLEKMTIEKIGYIPTFQDLKTKFNVNLTCITYNLTENKTEYLSVDNYPNLPCLIAIRMSSNLPLIFENFKYGKNLYVDGGISENFGIDIGDKIGQRVLGIYLDAEGKHFNTENDINIIEYIYKLMFIPISQSTELKIKNASSKCKIIKLSSNRNTTFFDFKINSIEKLNLFSSGYQETKEMLD
jgi:predicted acylesterase/phospholipase RssA